MAGIKQEEAGADDTVSKRPVDAEPVQENCSGDANTQPSSAKRPRIEVIAVSNTMCKPLCPCVSRMNVETVRLDPACVGNFTYTRTDSLAKPPLYLPDTFVDSCIGIRKTEQDATEGAAADKKAESEVEPKREPAKEIAAMEDDSHDESPASKITPKCLRQSWLGG